MSARFELISPLPPRRSAEALRDQLVDYLVRTNPAVGSKFLSDHQLARVSKLSRPTVRRALHDLHREGWIERRQGRGTFIGPRVAMPMAARPTFSSHASIETKRLIRLAVVVRMGDGLRHDWMSPTIIQGIDGAAEEAGVTIELLGDRDDDPNSISRRLNQTRPDVLAFCVPSAFCAFVIGEARRLGIPCIGTGTMLTMFDTHSVHADGFNAARTGVRHLIEQGHRRIGLGITPFVMPWVFHRRAGYLKGLEDAGIEADESLVYWGSPDGKPDPEGFERFLNRRAPTACLFANHHALSGIEPLVRSGKLRVPDNLSVVTFDQHPDIPGWLGVAPTTMAIPLKEIGRQLVTSARVLADGGHVEPFVELPCKLSIGKSVRLITK
jgi:LacI family transcriptional regulator